MTAGSGLPAITIHDHDYNQLLVAATMALRLGRPHAPFLLAELRRASLCRLEDLPDDVVSMDSYVTYRLARAHTVASRKLVFEHELAQHPAGLSIATPVGTAVLGLRVGDRMRFQTSEGETDEVVVDRLTRSGDPRWIGHWPAGRTVAAAPRVSCRPQRELRLAVAGAILSRRLRQQQILEGLG